MDDVGSAIQDFLAQPGAMDQVRAMAEQLGLGSSDREAETPAPALPALGEVPPETLGKLLSALNTAVPQESTALLEALRPLLRPEKREKVDRAIRAVRMMYTARAVAGTMEW